MDKTDHLEKKSKEKARLKAKSCRPPKDSIKIDPANNPNTSVTFSFAGTPKEKWDKIFGSKNNKKKSDKKT
jgi:hypothetical protein